jgi:hypothetical protein
MQLQNSAAGRTQKSLTGRTKRSGFVPRLKLARPWQNPKVEQGISKALALIELLS